MCPPGSESHTYALTAINAPISSLTGPRARRTTGPGEPDPRIRDVTALLLTETYRTVTAAEAAATCGLSTSRFLRLFKAHTGTTFRRYRLWARMLAAGRVIGAGGDLTSAAAEAGFATPSHFSDAFHRMFGLQPGRLLGTGVAIVTADRPSA
ncbi:AraC family transcriptional regulator [Actinomadura sp. 6K520]|nr:AraC family transcriptional regulator [Actinomadura sp. 6K520]